MRQKTWQILRFSTSRTSSEGLDVKPRRCRSYTSTAKSCKFEGFLLKKKKKEINCFFCACKVKIINEFWELLVKRRVFFSKNMVFKPFLDPISVSCCQISQHLVCQINIGLYRVFFSKNMVSKHFWTLFPFPVAKFLNIQFVKSSLRDFASEKKKKMLILLQNWKYCQLKMQ